MKIKISEAQLNMIKKNLDSNESVGYQKEFNVKSDLSLNIPEDLSADVDGKDYVLDSDFVKIEDVPIKFTISINFVENGIDGIKVIKVVGPDTIDVNLKYYIDNENTKVGKFTIRMNWNSVDINEYMTYDRLLIEKDIDVTVGNFQDENGYLIADDIRVSFGSDE
jgi:hypothetical protein